MQMGTVSARVIDTCLTGVSARWTFPLTAEAPEPGVLALLALGLAGLGAVRRRQAAA